MQKRKCERLFSGTKNLSGLAKSQPCTLKIKYANK